MNDFFNTLGIEATKEEKKIKEAYRARLHAVNPEDDPDGFKRLREAYEEALKYARQKGRRTRKSFSGRGIYFPVRTALQRFLPEN